MNIKIDLYDKFTSLISMTLAVLIITIVGFVATRLLRVHDAAVMWFLEVVDMLLLPVPYYVDFLVGVIVIGLFLRLKEFVEDRRAKGV